MDAATADRLPPDAQPAEDREEARRRYYASLPVARGRPCQYPLWGDERPTHVYCGRDRLSLRSYCAAHAALCYEGPAGEAEQPA